jgi:mannosyl-oligosaccharide alpha-1,2-mannosidase
VYAYLVSFHEQKNSAPFFETVIRYLGGLLSAYALSKDPILLARADDLGTALLPVFRTPSGLPMFSVNTVNGIVPTVGDEHAVFAEMLSCQMEYKYLSYLTGRKGYYDAVEKVMDVVYKTNMTSTGDLFPSQWSRLNGSPVLRSPVGGMYTFSDLASLIADAVSRISDRWHWRMYGQRV